MPPNAGDIQKALLASPLIDGHKPSRAAPRAHALSYLTIAAFTVYHLTGLYGLYLCFTSAKAATLVFAFFTFVAAQFGVTAGAHRLWSHNSFKAKAPLQILLMVLQTLAFQTSVAHWVRDHRLHHQYADSDGDPHNASRGFFYSHIGWLLTAKTKDLLERGKKIDMSDIHSNPVLCFQEKYYMVLVAGICFALPTAAPVLLWGEAPAVAWCVNMLRHVVNLQTTFMANSICHIFGYRPYDKNALATNNLYINLLILGDGFHNFHHAFPWDYQSSEWGNRNFNFTTIFIDFFAKIGWAYDRKTVSDDIVKHRKIRAGDGTDLWGRDQAPKTL